jgi:hypothetical protein
VLLFGVVGVQFGAAGGFLFFGVTYLAVRCGPGVRDFVERLRAARVVWAERRPKSRSIRSPWMGRISCISLLIAYPVCLALSFRMSPLHLVHGSSGLTADLLYGIIVYFAFIPLMWTVGVAFFLQYILIVVGVVIQSIRYYADPDVRQIAGFARNRGTDPDAVSVVPLTKSGKEVTVGPEEHVGLPKAEDRVVATDRPSVPPVDGPKDRADREPEQDQNG